jgi:hypothetical protein
VADPPLIVPVQLDALAVNTQLIGRDTFRWWPFNYLALDNYESPEPDADDRSGPGPKPGVHLHWVIPEALRRGAQDRLTGAIAYPRVPNRWLVARFPAGASEHAAGWVVESDCPFSGHVTQVGVEATSPYLVDADVRAMWQRSSDPYRSAATVPSPPNTPVANIGVPFSLADGWSERDAHSTFLTALGPANPAFPIFMPHNLGVFSFHDDLAGVAAGQVSYVVVGWYSNPADDVMAGWPSDTTSKTPYADLLASLDWTAPSGDTEQPTSSLFEGMTLGVQWDPAGAPPANDALQGVKNSGQLDAAIGNTTVDAFTALVANQLGAKGAGAETLLRAFQYDLLPELDQPGGDAVLERKARQSWFGSKPGTYTWVIVAAEGQDDALADLAPGEAEWLAQLNRDQAILDDAVGELHRLQWELNAIRWKKGRWPTDSLFGPPDGVASEDLLDQQLDPAFADPTTHQPSLAARTIGQIGVVQAQLARLPQPVMSGAANRQDAYEAGIAAFAKLQGLDTTKKVLKAAPSARYILANDPVIVLSGVEPPDESISGSLGVRAGDGLVSSLTVDGKEIRPADVASVQPALPGLDKLPAGVPALLSEWFLLDPANAPAIATASGLPQKDVAAAIGSHASPAYVDTLPDIALAPWTQPWQPMFMEWKVSYAALPYEGADGQPQWELDGDDYRFAPNGAAAAAETHDVGGISLLSPHAQVVLGARLADFIQRFGPEPELQQLYDQVEQVDSWRFLTQAMTGFDERLAVRDSRAYHRPDPGETIGDSPQYRLADTIGYSDSASTDDGSLPDPLRGAVGSVPYMQAGVSPPFHGVRQGQIYFEMLNLYDKFGRVLPVMVAPPAGLFDPRNFPLVVDDALAPGTQVDTTYRSVPQLPPRLLQHARLDFPLVDAQDPAEVSGQVAGANPVGGWVVANHLDSSLLLYAPDGSSLGEYRLYEQADGSKLGGWQPPPHDTSITQLADVTHAAPLVGGMLGGALSGEAAFDALLEVIDSTLWTTDPLGSRRDQRLSVLVGRPLALVRAQVGLALDGPPISDTSWAATLPAAALQAPAGDILTQPFGVRLGGLATRDDGLIGYWVDGDWNTFNSVAAPEATTPQDYVLPIGAKRRDGRPNYLSLLANGARTTMTMLVDPRGSVHATTGIVPVGTAAVPPAIVEAALDSIELTFRVAPALTFVRPTPTQEGATAPAFPESVVVPVPAEQNGTWSFWDQEPPGGAWTGYGLVSPAPQAQLGPAPPTLRDGLLQLSIDLDEESSS